MLAHLISISFFAYFHSYLKLLPKTPTYLPPFLPFSNYLVPTYLLSSLSQTIWYLPTYFPPFLKLFGTYLPTFLPFSNYLVPTYLPTFLPFSNYKVHAYLLSFISQTTPVLPSSLLTIHFSQANQKKSTKYSLTNFFLFIMFVNYFLGGGWVGGKVSGDLRSWPVQSRSLTRNESGAIAWIQIMNFFWERRSQRKYPPSLRSPRNP
jgi:hypothetical protein